ncbi:uncharacterized protein [Sinocyclocheilus grahami]|uniref:uncharacterized protein isoform X2 n=1 Tax=Sinocyclocheilus grahami TaxID=75366 RepID=UPI0007ACA632|nr:PREDICTED: uncharacterized protein LOC107584155 isoform X2 [Sinocyclocheilus grahami]
MHNTLTIKKRYCKNGVWEKKSKNSQCTIDDAPDLSSNHHLIGEMFANSFEALEDVLEELQECNSSHNDDDDESIQLFLESSDSDEETNTFLDEFVADGGEEVEILAEEQIEAYLNMQDGEKHGSDQSSEKPEDLLMKLLAMMILSWQASFKISDNAITTLLLCMRQFMWTKRSAQKKKCGSALLRKLKSSTGKEFVYPIRPYCYSSVRQSLEVLVKRPGFLQKCEEWRLRKMPECVFGDVYDGQVWKDYHYVNGEPFLSAPNNLAMMLNVDWFQPFKNAPYSVGAIYLVILNLPCEDRFKEENMILVGLIPGPKEPSLTMNAFLDPLVDELEELWSGIILEDSSFLGYQVYRAALLCLASDIPASRKCGGFVGHGAYRGCHKCLKTFSKKEFGAKMDFSGFDRSSWESRISKDHIHYAGLSKRAKTKAEQRRIEHDYGARWSELFRLSYYDPIRFVVIDPMHNLLLGTARHVFRLWTELGILTAKKLEELQTRVENIKVPHDVGRIPLRIPSGFTGFTADQWKNWTTIYSLFCLKGLINSRHYDMWFDFVQACIILCSRVISCVSQCFCVSRTTFVRKLYSAASVTIPADNLG